MCMFNAFLLSYKYKEPTSGFGEMYENNKQFENMGVRRYNQHVSPFSDILETKQ